MYRGFQVKNITYDALQGRGYDQRVAMTGFAESTTINQNFKRKVLSAISQVGLSDAGVINGDALESKWFPQIDFDVARANFQCNSAGFRDSA